MAASLHVNGEAAVYVYGGLTGYSQGSPGLLGVTVDGVKIRTQEHHEDVFTDTFGPGVPFDVQQFLEEGFIEGEFVFYDAAVLNLIHRRASGGAAAGLMGAAGSLLGAGGNLHSVLVTSPYESIPYRFPKCYVMDATEGKLGTRRTSWTVRWRALPYTGSAGTTAGSTLYTNV